MTKAPAVPVNFDPAKDAANRAKHGLSLAEAERLDWSRAFVVKDARHDYGEPRYRVYAMLDGRLHMAAVTWRSGTLRVISLRKANRREVSRYERQNA